MKQFAYFLLKTAIVLFVTMALLDVLYTTVYLQSNGRSKIDYLYQSKDNEYDVVFLGSSRVNNHFVPRIFQEQGYKTVNFGITRSRLEESALQLKLMLERHYKVKNLILQVDLNINTNDHSEAIRSLFMPYIHQSAVIRAHYQHISEYNALLYVPFYRYMHYDARIGFREMYQSAIHKPTNAMHHDGFYPLPLGKGKMIPADLSKYSPKHNIAYEEIKQLCAKNHIRLIAVTTPICTETFNREYFDQIRLIYPEIHNFENAVKEDKYFSTCGHMNEAGAIVYTKAVFHAFFKPKTQP